VSHKARRLRRWPSSWRASGRQRGKSGIEISDLFPHLGTQADRLCVIRSMPTEQINHDTAPAFMNTGSIIKGRPSMGSWLLYGLGSATDDLPGFIVLTSAGKYGPQPIAARQWSSGVLPSQFQGIMFQSKGDAVHSIGSPPGVCQSTQRQVVEEVRRLNGMLAERGVRMIQLDHRAWDHHRDIEPGMKDGAQAVDKPSAALIEDLARRGMLDDTLVLWGGEFGHTPMGQGSGRDHHILSFSVFLAGGGVKPGITWGATDEMGYRAVEDVVHVHDLHATMLALLGIDHHRLTTKFQGLDLQLTGVAGNVVKGLMA
jgi:hypothetical protein